MNLLRRRSEPLPAVGSYVEYFAPECDPLIGIAVARVAAIEADGRLKLTIERHGVTHIRSGIRSGRAWRDRVVRDRTWNSGSVAFWEWI